MASYNSLVENTFFSTIELLERRGIDTKTGTRGVDDSIERCALYKFTSSSSVDIVGDGGDDLLVLLAVLTLVMIYFSLCTNPSPQSERFFSTVLHQGKSQK